MADQVALAQPVTRIRERKFSSPATRKMPAGAAAEAIFEVLDMVRPLSRAPQLDRRAPGLFLVCADVVASDLHHPPAASSGLLTYRPGAVGHLHDLCATADVRDLPHRG